MSGTKSFSFRSRVGIKALSVDETPVVTSQARPGLTRLDFPAAVLAGNLSTSSTLDAEYNIDVIAVHGLGGDAYRTWTHPAGNLWLRDQLPGDLPGARVYTYAYNSAVMFSRNTATIRDYGRQLLENLRGIRKSAGEQARPVIFICHSMGGIVVKQALLLAHNEAVLYPDLFNAVRAILFFATPHQGSSTAESAGVLTRVINAAFIGSQASRLTGVLRSDLLKALSRNSAELTRIADDFRVHTSNLQITSFVEKKKMKGLNTVVVDDVSSFIGAPDELRIPMEDCDHREICRFESENDIGYQIVLRRMKGACLDSRNQPSTSTEDEIAKTMRVVSLPFRPNPTFVGRADILEEIRNELHDPEGERKVALYGLGGIGKSQILLSYAHQTAKTELERSVFWVYAGNPSRFSADYHQIAKALGLKGLDSPDADVLQLVKDALESEDMGPWLLIVDNVDDKDAFFQPPSAHTSNNSLKVQRSLASYIPECSHGSILYSTRDKACGLELTEQGHIIMVDKLSPADGELLLSKKLGQDQSNQEGWAELLEEVEYLPLAIVQAASYIRQKSLSVTRYLSNYREMSTMYLGHEFREKAREGGVTNAILKTWLISFEQIRKQDRRAADILCLMGFFNRQNIPAYLIQAGDERQADFDDAVGTLLAFSFMASATDHYSFSVHNLVQLAARLWTENQGESARFSGIALSSLSKWYPQDFQFEIKDRKLSTEDSIKGQKNRQRCAELLPHVDPVLLRNTPNNSNIDLYETLLQNCHVYLRKRNQFRLSEQYISALVGAMRSVLGDDNTRTIKSIGELGYLHYCQGNYADSERWVREGLRLCEALSSPATPDILEGLTRKLAWASQEQGKYEDAESLHRRVLARREKDLGMDSPATLDSLDDLGYTLNRSGKLDEAKKMLEQAVAGRERALGPDHPKTLRSVNRLATVTRALGDWAAAESMGRRVVAGTLATLGPDSGGTIRCQKQLAQTLEKVGKREEAEELYRVVMAASEEVLQPRDLGLLRSFVQFADFLKASGKVAEAAGYYERARVGFVGREGADSCEARRCEGEWADAVRLMNREDSGPESGVMLDGGSDEGYEVLL